METKITLLGTGSSAGIPILGCSCRVCNLCRKDFSSSNKNIRTRSSLMITRGGKNLIIDTCPDFRYQMLRNRVDHIDAVIYTHIHFDHTSGFDDLRAYSFWDKSFMDLYLPDVMYDSFIDRYSYFLAKDSSYQGTSPRVKTITLKSPGSSSEVCSFHLDTFDMDVDYFRFKHGNTDVFGYRFGSFLYLTDFKELDPSIIEYLTGKIKLAVISGISFREFHSIHSTMAETKELVDRMSIDQAVVTHICHDVDYYDPANKDRLGEKVSLGYDGMSISTDI